MEYKNTTPVLSGNGREDCERLLGYIEELKAETAVRLNYLEKTLEILKKEVSA